MQNILPIETTNLNITILSAIILGLIFVVIKLNIQFYKEKNKFKKKVEALDKIIVQISKNKSVQLEKINLSESLKIKLKTFNTALSSEVFELNKDLFEILSNNNLA